jgi:hypothetical protein
MPWSTSSIPVGGVILFMETRSPSPKTSAHAIPNDTSGIVQRWYIGSNR